MITPRLSKNSAGDYDLVMTDGKFEMVEDGHAASVSMLERITLFRSEAVASPIVDTTANPLAGVDFYGIIFKTIKSKAEKEIELKRAILSTPGIYSILRWSWTQTGRSVAITGTVRTDWGDLAINETLTPL